jgi:hypothetical protein
MVAVIPAREPEQKVIAWEEKGDDTPELFARDASSSW